jgi:hypothetical protein
MELWNEPDRTRDQGEFVRRLDAAARLAKRRDFQLEIPFRRQ